VDPTTTSTSTTTPPPLGDFTHAREEARRRGDRVVGAEHAVFGLIRDPELSGLIGMDLNTARDVLAAIDRDALKAIGIDAPSKYHRCPHRSTCAPATHPAAAHRDRRSEAATRRVPLTPAAKIALRVAGKDLRRGRLSDRRQVLAALLAPGPPDPAAEFFNQLGVDRLATRALRGQTF
jgi:hypothetical protein